ncbi:MAG TPA: acetate--CoA ligase family protein [Actinomycetes bacterium]|nr:acetate--CoA ligase family protein [Actinomycetes bacterium]
MDLTRLFAPASIAVVGATERPSSYGNTVVTNLLRGGFAGRLVGVHPERSEVHGVPCVPTLHDLAEPVDVVVIATPADTVPPLIESAGQLGCGAAVVFAAEFAETGRFDRQAALIDAAKQFSLPVIGPNANGVVALHHCAPMWGDVVEIGEPGAVALVTQSGNVGVTALASRRGLRWHTVVSVGNSAVVDAATALDQLATTEGVRACALYLEDDGVGSRWAEALAKCAENDVRVAVLKAGRSQAGAVAGGAHTAAVAGDHRIFRALVEEAGGAWCHDPHELLETAKLLATPRPVSSGGLAVLTCSGGDSVITADEADRLGVRLASLSAQTHDALRPLLPEGVVITNPLDHTNMLWADTEAVRNVIEVLAADDDVSQVLYVQDTPVALPEANIVEWKATRDGLVEAATLGVTKAVASGLPELMPAYVAEELQTSGVTAFAGIPTALRALSAHATRSVSADRLRAIARTATLQQPGAWIAEHEGKALLASHGVTVPEGAVAANAQEATRLAGTLGGHVVLKVSHADIRHKTELGGVVLGLRDPAEIASAADRLLGLVDGGVVLVEAMASPGIEMLVSATRDGVVPSLVVGLGGIWTELLDDVAVIPLPAGAERVRSAISRLRGYELLRGARGKPELAIDALCALAQSVGDALIHERLALIEINPVIVSQDVAVAVDAVVRR